MTSAHRIWINSALALLLLVSVANAQNTEDSMASLFSFEVSTIDGETTTLEAYRGKVILIVNTASKCGFTGQYEGLENLYKHFKDRDFVVLGFPANNFMNQEPGSNEEIAQFCKINYGVTFPMFEKISVKGENIHPLYQFLTSKEENPEHGGEITWNFNKFLVDKDGHIVNRFGSRTKPEDEKLVQAIQTLL